MSRVAMFHACEVHCCCNELDYGVRIESVSSGLRLWSGRNQVAAGDTCGPSVSVEGVATNDSAYVRYSVLDGDGETIRTITRTFRVAVEATITLDAMTCGGGALVIKRPTDPARFNSATGTVCVTGAAASGLILEGDKVSFEQSGSGTQTIDCGENGTQFVFYGDTPSETMNDASVTLKTIGGETLVSTNLTVLWVDISMRCGQGESLSPDNGMTAGAGSVRLGRQKTAGIYLPDSDLNASAVIANIVEFRGTVHPSDFVDEVIFTRDCVDSYVSLLYTSDVSTTIENETNRERGLEPIGNDENLPAFQDRSPQPNGRIYDVDTPGLGLDSASATPYGTTMFYRHNFIQYVRYCGMRCSNDFPWHCRLTARRVLDEYDLPDVVFFDRESVADDNVVASGRTTVDE